MTTRLRPDAGTADAVDRERAVAALFRRRATKRPDGGGAVVAPFAAAMLHLRARYVSKAAILTSPEHSVPVENRSFA